MKEQIFIKRRQSFWNEFERTIRGGKQLIRIEAANFPRQYRELTQDLNTARAHGFDPLIIDKLNALALEGNQLLYSKRSFSFRNAAVFVLQTFPRAVRAHWRSIAAVMFVFYGIGIFIGILSIRNPAFVYEVMGEYQAKQLEQMYNPQNEYFLIPREISSDADMFGFYIFNNISIAFRVFAGGILAGFGSLVILFFNAIFLGAASGHIINENFGSSFFPFIIAHSSFELTAIVLSAQAGLLLGYHLFFPRGLSRSTSIKKAGRTALPIISGAALMLVIAACIEAFWSSRHEFPLSLRLGSGIFCWLIVILYFTLAGRKKSE
jgi:uncharacterized membrane protein SpoIIM required for sporulation